MLIGKGLCFDTGGISIKPAPEMGTGVSSDYIIGLGTIDARMLILVDIDKLMSGGEMGLIDKLAA